MVTGAEIYTSAGVAGLGLIQVPRYRVECRVQTGDLVPVLDDCPPAPMPASILFPGNRNLAPRVRAFGDWLAELFNNAQASGRI